MLTAVLHHLFFQKHSACVWELRRLAPVVKSSAGVSSGLQGGHFLFTWTLLLQSRSAVIRVVILLK